MMMNTMKKRGKIIEGKLRCWMELEAQLTGQLENLSLRRHHLSQDLVAEDMWIAEQA